MANFGSSAQQTQSEIQASEYTLVQKLNNFPNPTFSVINGPQNKVFTLKCFNPGCSTSIMAFEKESRTISLKHKNILQAHTHSKDLTVQTKDGRAQSCAGILYEYYLTSLFELLEEAYSSPLNDEIFVRTLFKQLVEGVEYLHSKNVSHNNLNLESIVVTFNKKVKIADFEASNSQSSSQEPEIEGTQGFRAPEVLKKKVQKSTENKVDIYSLGVILFTLMTEGLIPFEEETIMATPEKLDMLEEDEDFWAEFTQMSEKNFRPEFKKLVGNMLRANPEKRVTAKDVLGSEWMKGPIYEEKEFEEILVQYM